MASIMSSSKPLKLLSFGDVSGRLSAFVKKLNSVHSKAGPFDLALCVGSFFGPDLDEADNAQMWSCLRDGSVRLPIPVYVLGPNRAEECGRFSDLSGYEMAENLVYLGGSGCLTTEEGLTIAYLSGREQVIPWE